MGEKFKARGILEGVNGVFFGEAGGMRPFEGVKVSDESIDERGRRCPAQQENSFSILDGERFLFCKGAL